MRIISLATDGNGRAHIAAIRAPDLWRRDIAARTGEAHLVYVAISPDGVAVDDLLARLDVWLEKSGTAPTTSGRFANAPTRIVATDPERIVRWLRLEIERASRPAHLSVRILAATRKLRRRARRMLASLRERIERGGRSGRLAWRSLLERWLPGRG